MTNPDLTAPEAVEAHIDRIDPHGQAKPKSLNDDTKTLLRALSASAEALDAKLKEAVEVLRMIESIRPMWEGGVRGTSADNLSNTLEHMRAEARAFLARLEGDNP